MSVTEILPLPPTSIPHLLATHIARTAKHAPPKPLDLAEAVVEVELQTQIYGASMLKLTLMDPDWDLATSGFLNVNADGLLDEIDVNFPEGSGSWWRLTMVDGSNDLTQPNLTLTFEDRIVSYLRDKWGPLTVAPGTTTRAQFVRQMVVEVGHGDGLKPIKFVCPSLNVVQPVAPGSTPSQPNQPAAIDPTTGQPVDPTGKPSTINQPPADATNKSKGLGNGAAVGIKGVPLDAGQVNEVNTLLGVANQLHAGSIPTQALICAAIGESNIGRTPGSFTPNSAGYWGVLQGGSGQNGSAPNFPDPHDTAGMATSFLQGGRGFQAGGAIALSRTVSDPGQIATQVEASGQPGSYYGQYLGDAQAIIAAGGGATLDSTGQPTNPATQVSDVGQLARGTTQNPDEDSWSCITRLATDVAWYAFSNANALYYMDGPDLAGQKPALYLDRVAMADQIAHVNYTFDNSAFNYQSVHKKKGKVQRRSRIARPQTPSQVRLNLVCEFDAYRAGDLFVLQNFGPANGRWIVADATRRCLSDTFTQFTLIPPSQPYPEPAGQQTGQPNQPGAIDPTTGQPYAAGTPGGAFAFPMPRMTAVQPGSWTQDQGVDIATVGGAAGIAAPLFAVAAGTVVKQGIQGFGQWAPVLKLDAPVGSYTHVYYGHAGPVVLANVGVHLTAGAGIASVGAGIVGNSSGPHLEIGFCDANGTPTPGSSNTMLGLLKTAYAAGTVKPPQPGSNILDQIAPGINQAINPKSTAQANVPPLAQPNRPK